MKAKEYYNNQDRFEYFTKLTNTGVSDDFDEIMAFAEAYHEHKLKLLGIDNVSNLLCGSFDPDTTTSSATKCKCGREKWEHTKAT